VPEGFKGMLGSCWLYDWLDVNHVRNASQAIRLLSQPKVRESLANLAIESKRDTCDGPLPSDGVPIVAARGIDLSGELGCVHFECLEREVETLFRRVWHYFDYIVVAEPPQEVAIAYGRKQSPDLERILINCIKLLLYLRKIGADKLLFFKRKAAFCEKHSYENMAVAGAAGIHNWAAKLVDKVAAEAEVTKLGEVLFKVSHPAVGTNVVRKEAVLNEVNLRCELSNELVTRHIAGVSSDLFTSKLLGAPLGSVLPFYKEILTSFDSDLIAGVGLEPVASVAFELNLPVLDGVSIETLLALRQDESPYFERFRAALRRAIREKIDSGKARSPDKIAEEIKKDVIQPALSEIEIKLRLSLKSLVFKGMSGVGLSSVMTIAGVCLNHPLLTAAGLAPALVTTINATQKYIEERRDVKLSDMYFLWEAHKHGAA
jgi:hypothetical protein